MGVRIVEFGNLHPPAVQAGGPTRKILPASPQAATARGIDSHWTVNPLTCDLCHSDIIRMRNHMSLQRWLTTTAALLLIATMLGIAFEGSAAGEDAKESSGTPVVPKVTEPVAISHANVDAALLEIWQKNIAEWKEWEPGEPADNSFCNVCHANLETEKLVRIHMAEGVGCETCHGISDKHSEDEDSLVPPDVIFAKSGIVPFCMQCHDKDALIEADSDHEKLFAALEKPQDEQAELQANGKKLKILRRLSQH